MCRVLDSISQVLTVPTQLKPGARLSRLPQRVTRLRRLRARVAQQPPLLQRVARQPRLLASETGSPQALHVPNRFRLLYRPNEACCLCLVKPVARPCNLTWQESSLFGLHARVPSSLVTLHVPRRHELVQSVA